VRCAGDSAVLLMLDIGHFKRKTVAAGECALIVIAARASVQLSVRGLLTRLQTPLVKIGHPDLDVFDHS
jgi:hypothetical protein